MSKIQKSLDYNKLKEQQAKGKLLKKQLRFPLFAQIKYDGAYAVVEVDYNYNITYHTSGGLQYHFNDTMPWEKYLEPGFYIAERTMGGGKLGTRRYTALTGPKTDQVASIHSELMFHDYLTYEEYLNGRAVTPYYRRLEKLMAILNGDWVTTTLIIKNAEQMEEYLKVIVSQGYEGLMLKDQDWLWKDTKSRNIECAKYKKRPTADLLCTSTTHGEGKYGSMIGALVLTDLQGREVQVGSGLTDRDRARDPLYFIGSIIEVEYEQIIDTYIQPTYICRRDDKTKEEID